MRTTIFRKALFLQDKLKEVGEGRGSMFFEYEFSNPINNIQVEVRVEDGQTKILSTDKQSTLHDNALSSYALGVIFYILKREMRKITNGGNNGTNR